MARTPDQQNCRLPNPEKLATAWRSGDLTRHRAQPESQRQAAFSLLCCSAFVLLCCSAALATPPGALRTEQGIADVERLGVTLRDMQTDLRIPTGFEGVYRLDRADPFGRRDTFFMRMDGGVTAIFPQSVYTPVRDGLAPTIPPGTIFYLGDLPPELRPEEPPRPRPANQIDLSIESRIPADPVPLLSQQAATANHDHPRPARPEGLDGPARFLIERSIWTDDAYRNRRIATLLRRAIEDGQAAEDPPRPAPAVK